MNADARKLIALKDKHGDYLHSGDVIAQEKYFIRVIKDGEYSIKVPEYEPAGTKYYAANQIDLNLNGPHVVTLGFEGVRYTEPLHEKLASSLEVLGNIYTNPSLLNIKEQPRINVAALTSITKRAYDSGVQ